MSCGKKKNGLLLGQRLNGSMIGLIMTAFFHLRWVKMVHPQKLYSSLNLEHLEEFVSLQRWRSSHRQSWIVREFVPLSLIPWQ
jgi:hypothetical protein